MNIRAISIYIGYLLLVEGAFMFAALGVAAIYQEQASLVAFLMTIGVLLFIGLLLTRLRRGPGRVYAREGFVTVALGWVLISFFGGLPFYISGYIPNLLDAWFESVSGFTTTGASILKDVEALSQSMLYWRSFTHWLGGMGVLVFMLAVVPLSKGSGETFHLLRAESPGPSVDKLAPTLRNSAQILYAIYIVLTIIQVLLLVLGGMPFFDSLLNTFATAGTGGFAIKNASIAAYPSPYLQLVIAVFMALFGVNFTVYHLILAGQGRAALKNGEVRLYMGIMLFSTLIIALNILPQYGSFSKAALLSFFQVSSIMTTTGFATADFNLWPQFSRYLLVVLMIFGACAGSTGGGAKQVRLLILLKSLKARMQMMLRPRAVNPVRMDGKQVKEDMISGVYAFMAAYAMICIVSFLLLSFDNKSMETTLSALAACFNNIGPGLDLVGPAGNYSVFSPLSKFVLSIDMLLGRLEIFPLLLLFSPSVWRRRA